MKVFVIFSILFVAAQAADVCYKGVETDCDPKNARTKLCKLNVKQHLMKILMFNFFVIALEKCNARYGAIDSVSSHLQNYANLHIMRSFEYLLMSTHYSNYEKNRAGFEKLYRGLSDSTWEDAINLIKYIGKRGGEMKFTRIHNPKDSEEGKYELYELQSMAKALDMHKTLAAEGIAVHKLASRESTAHHDPEISSYIEEEFSHKHADIIRKLSGYVTDLGSFSSDPSLALYLFDDYLQKQ